MPELLNIEPALPPPAAAVFFEPRPCLDCGGKLVILYWARREDASFNESMGKDGAATLHETFHCPDCDCAFRFREPPEKGPPAGTCDGVRAAENPETPE